MPCGSSVVVAVVRSGSRPEGLQDESTAGTAHLGLREEDRDAAVGWHDVRARARSADPAVATHDVPELSLLDVDTAAGAPRLPVQTTESVARIAGDSWSVIISATHRPGRTSRPPASSIRWKRSRSAAVDT